MKSVAVVFGENEVEVQVGNLQFAEIDDWVRRRFSIDAADTVIYHNSKGQGINPLYR